MRLLDRAAKRISVAAAPTFHRLRLAPVLSAAGDYLAFLSGQGSGSGWDERGEARAAASLLDTPDPVIFDVGANDGRWSHALARELANPRASYWLFECSPYVLPSLPRRLAEIPNARVVEAAVSEQPGRIALHTPTHGSGLASVHARRDVGVRKEVYETVEVDAVTIDGVVEREQLERIDLLKIDIEGHELAALQGAEAALRDGIVRALTFEFGSANVNSRTYFRDFWDLLADNFTIARIGPGGVLVPVERYTERLEYFRGATNYAARRIRG